MRKRYQFFFTLPRISKQYLEFLNFSLKIKNIRRSSQFLSYTYDKVKHNILCIHILELRYYMTTDIRIFADAQYLKR